MAVKAIAEVTVRDETDIDSLKTWYALTSSTTAPAKPTTTQTSQTPASPWTANEPTFQAGTVTNYLYTCIQTRWKDGSCTWETVQLSSSYEQAKQAWNKAQSAKDAVDNLQIGGTNYVLNSAGVLASGLGSAAGSRAEYRTINLGQSYMGITHGTQVTVSFDLYMTVNTANPTLLVYNTNSKGPKAFSNTKNGSGSNSGVTVSFTAAAGSVISERVSVTGYINDRTSPTLTDNYIEFYSQYGTSNWFSISNLKLEKGNKATDYTQAPEDQAAYVDSSVAQSTMPNLAITTGAAINPTAYAALDTYLSEPLESGQQYTFKLWDVDISNSGATSDNIRLMLYYCGGNVSLGFWDYTYFTDGHADELDITFTPYDNAAATTNKGSTNNNYNLQHSTVTNAARKYLRLYNAPSGTYTRNLTVGKWKLVKGGNIQNWSAAPEDFALATDSVEYIVGTQTEATNLWTGVTSDAVLVAGKSITYKLPYAGTSSAATLNLTLANGGTTGAKAIKQVYSTSSNSAALAGVTTHWPAGSIIPMTYDGSQWVVNNNNTNIDDKDARNVRFYNAVKAKSAITGASIIGYDPSDTPGYVQVGSGTSFDLSNPVLWTTANIAANGTNYANIYTQVYDRTLATCYDSFTGTANSIVFLVGTVSGNTFTVDASVLTCTKPSSEDGKCYMPIGRLGNQSNGKTYFNFAAGVQATLYAYLDGAFRQVNPTDIVATQRVYYRTSANSSGTATTPSGAALTALDSWVTENGNKWASNATTAANWTTKVTPIANGTGESVTKYLYLWTCEQRKRLDGTVAHTPVLLDDSTTVIDGGTIVTGSVSANAVSASSGTFATANIPALTADHIKANVISAVNSGTGKINADHINVTQITIGQSQVTDLTTDLGNKADQSTVDGMIDDTKDYADGLTLKSYDATAYGAYDLYVSEDLIPDQPYVMKLWNVDVSHTGKAAADLGVAVYYCGSSVRLGFWHGTDYFTDGHADYLEMHFTPHQSARADTDCGTSNNGLSGVASVTKKYVRLYNSVPDATGTKNLSVGSWRLEKDYNKSIDDSNKQQVTSNLLRRGDNFTPVDLAMTRTTVTETGVMEIKPTTSSAYAKFIVDYLDYAEFGAGVYKVSCEAKLSSTASDYTTSELRFYFGYSTSDRISSAFSSPDSYTYKVASSNVASDWTYYEQYFAVPQNLGSGHGSARVAGSQLSVEPSCSGSKKPVLVRNVRLEQMTNANVEVKATAIDYVNNQATLEATMTIDGIAFTPSSYQWYKNGSAISSNATSSTYSATDLNAIYTCECTW